MNLQMIGCNHRDAGLDVRQQLAFDARQASEALAAWQSQFPQSELVLISTCNRVELYAAATSEEDAPAADELVGALLDFRHIPRQHIEGQLVALAGRDVVRHLYRVAASLESMVVGEPQILAQVKQAYQGAQEKGCAGPLLHELFQSALRTANVWQARRRCTSTV